MRFYPKPRVGLGKGTQPLRCHPIIVEQVRPQGNDGSGINPAPPHAAFFHAAINDQAHRTLDHPAAYRVALLAPECIGTNPRALMFQIGDSLLNGLTRLSWQSLSQVTQALHGLIHPTMPEPVAVQIQLVIALLRGEGLGARRHADGMAHLTRSVGPNPGYRSPEGNAALVPS
jgi:hypothetical protein